MALMRPTRKKPFDLGKTLQKLAVANVSEDVLRRAMKILKAKKRASLARHLIAQGHPAPRLRSATLLAKAVENRRKMFSCGNGDENEVEEAFREVETAVEALKRAVQREGARRQMDALRTMDKEPLVYVLAESTGAFFWRVRTMPVPPLSWVQVAGVVKHVDPNFLKGNDLWLIADSVRKTALEWCALQRHAADDDFEFDEP